MNKLVNDIYVVLYFVINDGSLCAEFVQNFETLILLKIETVFENCM